VAASPAPTAPIELIQINKAYKMRLFFNKNAIQLKLQGILPETRWRSFQRFPNPPSWCKFGVIRARYCILYEQFSHECY